MDTDPASTTSTTATPTVPSSSSSLLRDNATSSSPPSANNNSSAPKPSSTATLPMLVSTSSSLPTDGSIHNPTPSSSSSTSSTSSSFACPIASTSTTISSAPGNGKYVRFRMASSSYPSTNSVNQNNKNKNDKKSDTDCSTSTTTTTPLASKQTDRSTPPLPTPRPGAIASFSFACTSPSPDLPRSHSSISTTSADFDPTTPLLVPGRRYPIDRNNSSCYSQSSTLSSDSTISSSPSFLAAPKSGDVPQRPPHLGLASFLLWLRDHPSSSKVGSENMARFLLVKSVSIIAASLGCIYGILFDTVGSTFSMYSLLLFFIPAIQGLTGATRICGLALSMAVAAVYISFQNRLLPLLGPSLETTLLFGLPLVTGMLVGRKVGLLTSLAVIGFSIAEYRSRAKSADLTEDEASRLWAGFGAYWLSLLFFGTITCLYQWCVEVCVNDANLFKDIAIANAKSKDGVVSSVSHELRTPLAALIGWTELLLSDHTLSNSARSTVSMLHSSTLSLLTILNALLDVSKVSAAKMTTCSQNFNLHDLVLDTARMMTGLSGTRSVELLVDFSAQVPELVRADSGLIKQVLGNLVSNAIKFTDVGYVNVGVTLKDEDDDSVTVEFVVQDTGKGIPDEQKDKLFVEFSQVEGGKCKSHEAGTGLGLFLVKNLVELMKGTVFMQSEVGVGSTFGFVIKMEKQYLAFRTPGYDHVVTVSSAFQSGLAQQALDLSSPMLPVTPGLARSTTPLPAAVAAAMAATTTTTTSQLAASSSDPEVRDPSKPKDYFNLQPVEETRANANNITLRTRDNAFLSNRRYFIHSQCNYFEDFLWKTAAGPWQAIETRRLTYENCMQGWEPEPMPAKPLVLFGDVYLIDLSPTTNRPRNANELSDQEHVQQFLSKLARHLIKLAKMHIGKVRQASIILFYPFGHPPSLAQEPFVELSALYQISLCRKPVSERALGSIVKRQQIVIQSNGEMTPDVLGPRASEATSSSKVASGTSTAIPTRSSSPMVSNRQCSSDSTNSLTSEEGQANSTDSKGSATLEASFGEPSLDGFKLTLPKGGLNSIRKQANKLNGMSKASEGGSSPATAAAADVAASAATTASVRFAKRSTSSSTSTASTASRLSTSSSEPMPEKPVKSLLKNGHLASMESIQDLNASGRRVLIVDDNIVNRNLLLQQLTKLGVSRIDQAKSGQEAVELFAPGVHSLVLMDLNMPAMNGFQATTLIREKELKEGGPFVSPTPTITTTTSTAPTTRPEVSEPTRRVSGLDHDSGTSMDDSPWLPELYVGHPGHFHRRSNGTESHDKQGGSSPKTESDAAPLVQSNISAGRGRRSVTIIALTADWAAEVGEDREKAINGGFDDVVVKPISLPSLSVLLNRYMINRVD